MTEKYTYLVQRYEMTLDDQRLYNFPERAFLTMKSAIAYCRKQDPDNAGFEYVCPCGCGDAHWRSWDVVLVVMEEE